MNTVSHGVFLYNVTKTEYFRTTVMATALTAFLEQTCFPTSGGNPPDVVHFSGVTSLASPPGLSLGFLVYVANFDVAHSVLAAMTTFFATPASRAQGVASVISTINTANSSYSTGLTDVVLGIPASRRRALQATSGASALFGNVFFRQAVDQRDTSGVTPGFCSRVNVTVSGSRLGELPSLPRFIADSLRVSFGQYLSGTCAKHNAQYGEDGAGPCAGLAGFYGDDSDLEFAPAPGHTSVLTATFYAPSQEQADRNAGLFKSLMPANAELMRFLRGTGAAAFASYQMKF